MSRLKTTLFLSFFLWCFALQFQHVNCNTIPGLEMHAASLRNNLALNPDNASSLMDLAVTLQHLNHLKPDGGTRVKEAEEAYRYSCIVHFFHVFSWSPIVDSSFWGSALACHSPALLHICQEVCRHYLPLLCSPFSQSLPPLYFAPEKSTLHIHIIVTFVLPLFLSSSLLIHCPLKGCVEVGWSRASQHSSEGQSSCSTPRGGRKCREGYHRVWIGIEGGVLACNANCVRLSLHVQYIAV
jgi:hypothetical protein